MHWELDKNRPLCPQLCEQVCTHIALGHMTPGEKLPSVRELALSAGVNPNTMQKALAELERKGLVFSERTSGRFVTKEEKVLKALHEELARKYFEEFADKLRKIGMSGEDIAGAVKKWLEDIR